MDDQPENTPKYWRMKAQQARIIAESLKDPHARVHMLAAAESYDRLAELAERQPPHLHITPKAANTQ